MGGVSNLGLIEACSQIEELSGVARPAASEKKVETPMTRKLTLCALAILLGTSAMGQTMAVS